MSEASHATARRPRLYDLAASLSPWVKAEKTEGYCLYWLPISGFPVMHDQRIWLQQFYLRFAAALGPAGLRPEVFLQLKMFTNRRSDRFKAYRAHCSMLLGLSRKPGAAFPEMPTAEQAAQKAKEGEPVRIEDSIADYCYWLEGKTFPEHIEAFLGGGGLLTVFLKPDPKPRPAPLPFTPRLRAAMALPPGIDLDAITQSMARRQEDFLRTSKLLFGKGLEQRPEYPGLQYILPLLDAADFLQASPEQREVWFGLFAVYLQESADDRGILLSFARDFEPALLQVLDGMRADGLEYPIFQGSDDVR